MKTSIYLLVDPRTNLPCYVGQTVNIKERYYHHIYCKGKKNTKKISWIKSLLSKGIKPILEVIDEVPENEWRFWEQYYISLYSSWGFILTNSDKGGVGRDRGFKHSKETKLKQKENLNLLYANGWSPRKNKKHNAVTKEKMSIKKLGKSSWNKGVKGYKHKTPRTIYSNNLLREKNKCNIVYQINKESKEIIKEWESISLAAKTLNIHTTLISNCCKGKIKTTKGFIWQYKNNSCTI